jgi:hypothetical protein
METRKYLPPRFCVLKSLFISPLSQQACPTPPSIVPLKDILKTFDLFFEKESNLEASRISVPLAVKGRAGEARSFSN